MNFTVKTTLRMVEMNLKVLMVKEEMDKRMVTTLTQLHLPMDQMMMMVMDQQLPLMVPI